MSWQCHESFNSWNSPLIKLKTFTKDYKVFECLVSSERKCLEQNSDERIESEGLIELDLPPHRIGGYAKLPGTVRLP
jgi:hypothetical protein